ncbi:S-layer homology domain-containing protein [Paenibacillus sp. PK4536]|uniref:S-layer homology domain-containing protein n=1 Tax=Paenibacillus sp. PK4536 TaxID=3024576 RepID=UPI0023598A6C|nr:S-layer homology domain-containing protein [Paenibacillus sp. PK4536]WIM40169.1 S-layer homology domain-containing protein [Paenibacillus sp. PK4536]
MKSSPSRPWIAFILTLVLTISTLGSSGVFSASAYAADESSQTTTPTVSQAVYTNNDSTVNATVSQSVYSQAIAQAMQYIDANGGVDGDWIAVSYARTGKALPASYYSSLRTEVTNLCAQAKPSVTELARMVIAGTSAGLNATNISNCNLIDKLVNHDNINQQGVNGPMFALIALDSGTYQVPNGAKQGRDTLINSVVAAINGPEMATDYYGMALSALAPYKDRADVQTAGQKAVNWLIQKSDDSSSESIAQTIIGLASFGLNPTDLQFEKNGKSLIDRLLAFQNSDGGFRHELKASTSDKAFSTDQALRALIAYDLYTQNAGVLYTNPNPPVAPQPEPDPTPTPEPGQGNKVQASVTVEGPAAPVTTGVTDAVYALDALQNVASQNGIKLTIASASFGKYVTGIAGINSGDLDPSSGWLFAVKRNGQWISPDVGMDAFVLEPSDQVYVYFGAYGISLVESVTTSPALPKSSSGFNVTVQKADWVWNNDTFTSDKVVSPAADVQVQVGNQTVTTNAQGIASFNKMSAGSYTVAVTGYRSNNVPVIVRNTSTLIVANDNSTGGSTTTPTANTITMSVTGDSTILPTTSITLQNRDTAFSVLLRQLGSSRVSYRGSGGTAYVTAIDGLSEFDKGPLSGWVYTVNGQQPNTGAGAYTLKAGDNLTWRYSDGTATVSGGGGGSANNSLGVAFPATIPSQVESELSQLKVKSTNQLPVQEAGQTTTVLNSGSPMTASIATSIAKALESAPKVSVSTEVKADQKATLADPAGKVQFIVPANSVKSNTRIGIEEEMGSRPELVSSLYEFTPNGQQFEKPVYLSFKIPVYNNTMSKLTIAWLNEATNQWIPVPTALDAKTGIITGTVSHFTKYAVINSDVLASSADLQQLTTDINTTVKNVLTHDSLTEWEAVGIARAGGTLPASYLTGATAQVKESAGSFRKVTDLERLILGIKAAGGNPTAVNGVNLIDKMVNHEKMTAQGTNGPIFALIALNSDNYNVASTATWNKDKLVTWLLNAQNSDGGFPLATGEASSVDMTAMAVAALAPERTQTQVQTAIDKAVQYLSTQQQANGGYSAYNDDSSESVSQVIVALASAGINPKDARFTKSSGDLMTRLSQFRQSNGAYSHTVGGAGDNIATEQALLALVAYQQYLSSGNTIYNLANSSTSPVDTGTTTAVTFTDENTISAWATDSVHRAYDAGLMLGVSDQELRFAPKQQLTRAQFAALVVRLTGATESSNTPSNGTAFKDVSSNQWYYNAIMTAKSKGIITGINATSFQPNQPVSRQDMAVMLTRAFALKGTSNTSFADQAKIGNYARPAVSAVVSNGIMVGANNTFDPQAKVTREMAAVVAINVQKMAQAN